MPLFSDAFLVTIQMYSHISNPPHLTHPALDVWGVACAQHRQAVLQTDPKGVVIRAIAPDLAATAAGACMSRFTGMCAESSALLAAGQSECPAHISHWMTQILGEQ